LYLDTANRRAIELAGQGEMFQALGSRIGSIQRQELLTMTDVMEAALIETDGALAGLEVPPAAAGAAALLALAIDSWRDGLAAFEAGILTAVDEPTDQTAADVVASGLFQARSGDRLYLRFVEEADRLRGDLDVGVPDFPEVVWVPDNLAVGTSAPLYVAQAHQSINLPLRAQLVIQQVSSDPAWVANPEGDLVIRATSTLSVQAVVVNRGNAPLDQRPIFLDLARGDEAVDSRESEVRELDPGESTAVIFEDLEVEPGTAYTITVRVALAPGEIETEDNLHSVDVRINEPA
ncbi:MAG: hypothetical protein ACRDVM_10100, partial [Acidimicrobiia bacterium]